MLLNNKLHKQISTLSAQGDSLAEGGNYEKAIRVYEKAIDLLPKPVTNWSASTWLFSAIGDAYYLNGNYREAQNAFQQALLCPEGIGNPFIHLRLGQSNYELGNLDIALDELARAYMGAGEEIFEDQDPKYLIWVKSSTRSPKNK